MQRGVFAWLTTPFDEAGAVDLAALRRNMQGYGGAPLGGYVVGGPPGEFERLAAAERAAVADAVLAEAGGRPVWLAAAGSEPPADAGRWAERGAAGWLVAEAGRWRARAGDGAPPVLVNTAAADLRAAAGRGDGAHALPAAAALPFELCTLWALCRDERTAPADEAADGLEPVLSALEGGPGVVKLAMDLLGYRGGPVRPPGTAPTAADHEALVDALRAAGLIRF